MATALRPIGHDDRLSLVDHLDELRTRLVICLMALLVAFGFCFWQNKEILKIVTRPVEKAQNSSAAKHSRDPLEEAGRFDLILGRANTATARSQRATAAALTAIAAGKNLTPAQHTALAAAAAANVTAGRLNAQAAQAVPRDNKRQLVTLGVTEPFTSTITITMYASLLLVMPLLLYQAYAFILPAFNPRERKIALPIMAMVPFLFIAGVVFGYFVVLDRAVEFLQNFNNDSYDILLQAQTYFKFAVILVGGVGLLFQIPVVVIAVTRSGILTPRQLRKNRGYVILIISILAAVATPTPDPFTMTIAMLPLIVLFELSILGAAWLDRISPRGVDRDAVIVADPEDDL